MGAPCADPPTSPPLPSRRRFFLQDSDVDVTEAEVRGVEPQSFDVYRGGFPLSGSTGGLLLVPGQGGRRNEEVDAASLELRLRRDDVDAADDALSARLAEDVVGVGLEDLSRSDGAGDLLHEAIQVDDPNEVQSSAGKDAGQTTPQAVPH